VAQSTATILLADNDPVFLSDNTEILEGEGYHVIQADNPRQAELLLEQGGIDVAVLDERLANNEQEGDNSGLLVARNTAPQIPKIVLTAFASTEGARDALRKRQDGTQAALDYLSKGMGPEAILQAIKSALAHRDKPARASGSPQPEAPTSTVKRTQTRLVLGIIAIVLLLLALGAGVLAVVTGEPRWLVLCVLLAILMLANIGFVVFRTD
jgi:DNA-binding NtrC family response regulator